MREPTKKQLNRYVKGHSDFSDHNTEQRHKFTRHDRRSAQDDIETQLEEWEEDDEYGFRSE